MSQVDTYGFTAGGERHPIFRRVSMSEAAKPNPVVHVTDIMVSEVISVDLKMKLWQVAEMFVARQISGAPVIDNLGRVVTMIGEGALLRLAASEGLEATVAHCLIKLTPAKDVLVLHARATFTDAYRMFLKPNVRRIPVTDDNGKIIGMLTRSIILRMFVEAHYGRAIPRKT